MPRSSVVLLLFALAVPLPAQAPGAYPTLVPGTLAFEPDAEGAAYRARGPGYDAVVERGELTLVPSAGGATAPLRIGLADTCPTRIVAEERLPGVTHYLLGRDTTRWRTAVPRYGRLRCEDVRPGVALEFHGDGRRLEYDLVLAAGVSPEDVRLCIEGSAPVRPLPDGELEIPAGGVTLVQEAPIAWHDDDPARTELTVEYVLHADGTIGFAVEGRDPTRPLRIDPVIAYATYLGGTGADAVLDLARDTQGNLYLVGYTSSANFPLRNPFQPAVNGLYDMFVTKLDPTGTTLIWSTVIGGSGGYGVDEWALAVDVGSQGRPAVLGLTENADFPTANAFQPALAGK